MMSCNKFPDFASSTSMYVLSCVLVIFVFFSYKCNENMNFGKSIGFNALIRRTVLSLNPQQQIDIAAEERAHLLLFGAVSGD